MVSGARSGRFRSRGAKAAIFSKASNRTLDVPVRFQQRPSSSVPQGAEPIHIPPRRSLTPNQRAKLFEKHGGVCYLCTRRIAAGEKWIDEHVNPREISADDSAENRRPVHVECAKTKTRADHKTIAKVKRVRNKHLGLGRGLSRFAGSKDGRYKKKINGTVVDRRTGEPIR